MNKLNEKEQKVFEYIRDHEGCSKESVVNGMNGNPSRITVLKILHTLEHHHKMIEARKKKPNSQIYSLYINKENLMASLELDLHNFENTYFLLLKKIKDKLEGKRRTATKTEMVAESDKRFFSLLVCMFTLYEDMFRTYLMRSFVIWPKETNNDGETLKNLYEILFSKLAKIQERLTKALLHSTSSYGYAIPVLNNVVRRSLELPEHIEPTLKYCKEYGLGKEAEDTVDSVWKVAVDLFKMVYRPEKYGLNQVTEWRQLLELLNEHPDLRDKMNRSHDSFFIDVQRRRPQ
jgi:hypothetical protein